MSDAATGIIGLLWLTALLTIAVVMGLRYGNHDN